MWFTIQIKRKSVENKENCGVKGEDMLWDFRCKNLWKNFRLWKSGLGGSVGDPNGLDLWYDVYIFMAQLDVSITSIVIYLMHFTMILGLIQKRKSETHCLRIVIPG